MNDIAQTSLKEPAQVDWDNLGKSGYQAPPPEVDANGKKIVYYGKADVALENQYQDTDPVTGDPLLTYKLDPVTITQGEFAGYQLRFAKASTRPFTKNVNGEQVPIKGNPNSLGNYLRACGSVAKPQTNSEYIASVNAVKNKVFPFTIEWEARNKDTGEVYRGQASFPDDPARPGQKKTILHAGDIITVVDKKGVPTGAIETVKAEVLFVNAKVKYFQDPKKGTVN
jgi:hypothetical protein